jgi:hypothetical protein
MLTPARTCAEGGRHLPVPVGQPGAAGLRPCAVITLPRDLPRPAITGGTPGEGPSPRVCMLQAVGPGVRRGGQGRRWAGARRQRGLLVHRQHQRIRTAWPRVARAPLGHRGRARGLPRRVGRAPPLRAPGLQVLSRQHPPSSRGGHRRAAGLSAALARQGVALPVGETAAQALGACAGHADHGAGHRRGTNRPERRGQARRPVRRGAGRATAAPTGGRRRVGRRPPAPPGSASAARRAAGSGVPDAPALRPSWSTAASGAGSPAQRGLPQGPQVRCAREPWPPPPVQRSDRAEGRPPRLVTVKQCGTVFHDGLY